MRNGAGGDDAAVIVVGGGHAGIEAALAAARTGAATILVSGDPSRIGTLACNPSIGGSAKGQLVREVDALGGAMARITDRVSVHARFLNESKGPAARALRHLADKPGYVRVAGEVLRAQAGLRIVAGMVDGLEVAAGAVRGVRLAGGVTLRAPAVVLATGTFLGGRTFRGDEVREEGRFGEAPAIGLSAALATLGFRLRRLKTGTPPRVARESIDRSAMTEQSGSAFPLPFAYDGSAAFAGPQLPCWIVETSEATHRLVRDNLHRSPLYGLDLIRGIGPRYCPSIEDKVVKFAHNPTHQVFVEPEGWDEPTLYVGGFSTSLPADVQLAMLRTLPGFADVELVRAGYAVEYDAVDPAELAPTLETRRVRGLFHAGQLNGTSGYEEAAAQGLLAGLNAARRARGRDGVVVPRSSSYLGTMVDDLVTKGVDEPYRMLTSRAEHRVLLRHDNADLRLTPLGREAGLIDDAAWAAFEERRAALARGRRVVARVRLGSEALAGRALPPGSTVESALRRPDVGAYDVAPLLGGALEAAILERVAIEIKMDGYVRRQQAAIERAAAEEALLVPDAFDFSAVRALSREAREKLERVRPRTVGQAGRIPGLGPADLALLTVAVQRECSSNALSPTR